MSYQVLARKYRPRRFADMVGQEPVVRTLTNALESGRVHHAYVFSGIRGIGKTTSARLLASALNCASGPTPEPCGSCPACGEIAEGRSIDAIEIDAASNRGIDEIKALIQSAQYSPSRDRHKIFIVDEFHMLTREAFNALLKTLEEPPPHVVFILATTELEKVPATILSRCLLLPFRPVSPARLREHLLEIAGREGVSLDPEAADLIARKAGGSIRDGQSTLDRVIALAGDSVTRDVAAGVLGLTDAVVVRAALAAALDGRAGDALKIVDDVSSSGCDLHSFVDELLAEARGALLVKILDDPAAILGLPAATISELGALAVLGSEDDLRRIVDRLIEAGPRLRVASEPRYVVEALLVRLAHLTRLEPLAEIARRLAGGEGSAPGSAPGGGPQRGRGRAGEGERGVESPGAPTGASPARDGASPARDGASPAPSAPARPPAPQDPVPPPPRGQAPPATPSAGSWRERLNTGAGSAGEEEPALDPGPEQRPEPSAAPRSRSTTARAASVDPLDLFRRALPARMRGHVEHGMLRREADGLAIVLPPDREAVRDHVEEHRFHLVAAAAEAFGRPVPVLVVVDADLLVADSQPGQIEGAELLGRRREGRAERSSLVRGVLGRFDGRIVGVVPVERDAAPPSGR